MDSFLLTVKVANLVSFKLHDQSNVSQAGTGNISTVITRKVSVISPVVGPRLFGRVRTFRFLSSLLGSSSFTWSSISTFFGTFLYFTLLQVPRKFPLTFSRSPGPS